MDNAWTVGSYGRKEVLRLESLADLLETFAIAGEEDCTSPWTITHTNHIALHQWRTIRSAVEWLVVSASAGGGISNRVFVEAYIVGD